MPSLFLSSAILYSFALSQGSIPTATGSSNNCTALLSNDTNTINSACGGFTAPSHASVSSLLGSIPQLVANLDQVCAPKCLAAFSSLANDYTSGTCASAVVDAASGVTGSLVGTVYNLLGAITCTRVNNQYCIVSEAATLLPLFQNVNQMDPSSILTSLTPLATNATFICSACFIQQIQDVSKLKNVDASLAQYIPVLSNLTSACKSNPNASTTTTTTPKNGAIGGSIAGAGLLTAISVAVLAFTLL